MNDIDDKDLAMICGTVVALFAIFLVNDPGTIFSHLVTLLGGLAVGRKLQ